MPKVFNKRDSNIPSTAVYIGRGSTWGNPYVIGQDGDRSEVCDKYIAYVSSNQNLIAKVKRELAGKDLVCFCKPKQCHGDYLLKLANS